MNTIDAIILGLVEGVTEYLPVSSTGHLILTAALLGLDRTPSTKAAVDAFNIVIQGGAILAVLGLYWPRVRGMIEGLLGRNPAGRRLAINLVVAFLPAAVLGVLFDDLVERWLFRPLPVMAALALGGLLMIMLGPWQRRVYRDSDEPDGRRARFVEIDTLTWKQALVVGLLQTIAMWPGTSRSMMTIVGGMFVGLRPRQAAEFSFLLGLPTLGGACVYKALDQFTQEGPNMVDLFGWEPLIVGFLVATAAAAFAVRWLVRFLTTHGLSLFGWYRLILCAVLGIFVWRGGLEIGPVERDPASVPELDASAPIEDLPEIVDPD